jgi:glycosyltransferase involved in cell wall biosynthesis
MRDQLAVVFMGSGEMADSLRSQAIDSGLANRTFFVGFQNQTSLSRYYHAADLLVMPSRHGETWGLVVNEALHHGLPCVVTDAVGSAPDLIEPGTSGEIATASSPPSLASAILRALPMLGSRQTRDNCRGLVSRYSLEAAAAGIASAYAGAVA